MLQSSQFFAATAASIGPFSVTTAIDAHCVGSKSPFPWPDQGEQPMATRSHPARSIFAAVAIVAAASLPLVATAHAEGSVHTVPGTAAVPDSYLVVLKPTQSGVAATAQALASQHGAQVRA